MTISRMSFPEIVQTLAAYVAIPVALVYPFGFFALFVQFTKYFRLDFYTAWYAASLVNRMVAIGQGVTILVLALVVSVLLSAKIAQILLKHKKLTGPSRLKRSRLKRISVRKHGLRAKLKAVLERHRFVRRVWLGVKLTSLLLSVLILYIVYSRILAGGRVSGFVIRGRASTECNVDEVSRHQLNLWPDSLVPALIFAVGCSVGGWLIYTSYRSYRASLSANQRRSPSEDYRLRPRFFSRGATERWILSGLVTAYAASVIASVTLAAYTPAFVPFVTRGDTVEFGKGKEPTDNRFLSHTEGQWYILHRIDDESPREYRIVSLEQGRVDHMRVSPNPPLASRVSPLPWGLAWPPSPNAKDCKAQKDK